MLVVILLCFLIQHHRDILALGAKRCWLMKKHIDATVEIGSALVDVIPTFLVASVVLTVMVMTMRNGDSAQEVVWWKPLAIKNKKKIEKNKNPQNLTPSFLLCLFVP